MTDRLWGLRDRLLASEDFRRWAARFPGTRFIARRRAAKLFDLCAGFVYSQVLLACVRLELFDRLALRPHTAEELAHECELPLEAAERLLAAATSLDLVETRGGGRHGLGPLGAAIVGNRAVAAMVEHHPLLYCDLEDPLALLRGQREDTAMSRYWPYARADDPRLLGHDEVGAYSRLMAESNTLVAEQVLDAYDFAGHQRILDVGGGAGAFVAAVARRHPDLRLTLFDLPAVVAVARDELAKRHLSDRTEFVGGDFFEDSLPAGADLVTLNRILHDHDDERVLRLLRSIRRAIAPEGTLLVAEPMSQTIGAEAMGDAYFAFYLMAMGSGRPRSPAALQAMLESAGFTAVRTRATHMPLQTRLISARPA